MVVLPDQNGRWCQVESSRVVAEFQHPSQQKCLCNPASFLQPDSYSHNKKQQQFVVVPFGGQSFLLLGDGETSYEATRNDGRIMFVKMDDLLLLSYRQNKPKAWPDGWPARSLGCTRMWKKRETSRNERFRQQQQ
uniref:Uncharacterized protein n=1 Tax=Entomoneis paludosa TaxID=265537 RepID=A0A7S2YKT0_9STRA|mmetsp:Transcript_37113/g.77121  ORF Transcript_37113/g.77121 Transcript_37113/m.77121 type:complete len:135 (+) Transcript_37113:209-613(+)